MNSLASELLVATTEKSNLRTNADVGPTVSAGTLRITSKGKTRDQQI